MSLVTKTSDANFCHKTLLETYLTGMPMFFGAFLVPARSFLEVHRAGSIAAAADKLGLSQPAVAGHIRIMEQLIQKPLFIRQGRTVVATQVGETLALTMAQGFDTVDQGLASAQDWLQRLPGPVHLCGPSEFMSQRIAPTLAELGKTGISLHLSFGTDHALADWAANSIDLAIMPVPPKCPEIEYMELSRDRLLFIAAPALANRLIRSPVLIEALRAMPMLSYDDDLSFIRAMFQTSFHAEVDFPAIATVPNFTMLAELAANEVGWTVLPEYAARPFLQNGKLKAVPIAKSPANTMYLVWQKSALANPRVVFVRDHLLSTVF